MLAALRTTILPLPLLLAIGASGARGVLKADGIIRVKGADLHSTHVTVVPGNAASYGLPVGSKHIMLELPLDDVYLISVQRAGCPTKEVYFDTRVPVEMHAKDFSFPFMVTLEHLAPERMFAYEGPVGFVRYVHGLEDFGYETSYIVRVEDELKQRMRAIRETGTDPKVMSPITQVRVVDRPRGEYSAAAHLTIEDGEGIVAPMAGHVPRLVHVVGSPDPVPAEPAQPVTEEIPVIPAVPAAPLPSPPSTPEPLPVTAALPPASRVSPAPATAPSTAVAPEPVRNAVGTEHTISSGSSVSRSEELIADSRRVTRIVRFTRSTGTAVEYRKVTHAFGGVYYFQDGISITERAFVEATGVDDLAGK